MRRTSEKQFADTVLGCRRPDAAELAMRFAKLTRRLEMSEAARRGNLRDAQQADAVIREHDGSDPIEFLTENGFSIVRPWEMKGSPVSSDGSYRFRVSDMWGKERDITVQIPPRLFAETALHTCGRVQSSSSFWSCCAERQLATYLWEHDAFPAENNLTVDSLDPDEVILAKRWYQKPARQ